MNEVRRCCAYIGDTANTLTPPSHCIAEFSYRFEFR